jgi:tetratricopeptide (TPR) repeat protein
MAFTLQPLKILMAATLVLFAAHDLLPADTIVLDADRQFEYAAHLQQQGRYLNSAAEYQRFAFYFPADPRVRLAEFKAGQAYLDAGDIASAKAQFQSLTKTPELDAVAADAYFMLTECHLKAREPGQALIVLHNLMALSQDQALRDRALLRMGWIHIHQLDWSQARLSFERISPQGRETHQIDELINALNTSDALQLKSPGLAGTLSIIPGLGQMYLGCYEDALIAFVVDVGLLWAAYESFDNDLNVLGSMLAIVGIGFYASNIYSAVSSAHKYNDTRKHRLVDQLRHKFEVGLGSSPHASGPNLVLTLKYEF